MGRLRRHLHGRLCHLRPLPVRSGYNPNRMKSLGQYNNSIQDFVARLEFATLKWQQETVNWNSSELIEFHEPACSKNIQAVRQQSRKTEELSPKQISIDVKYKNN